MLQEMMHRFMRHSSEATKVWLAERVPWRGTFYLAAFVGVERFNSPSTLGQTGQWRCRVTWHITWHITPLFLLQSSFVLNIQ